jgi:hypothetical protein
MVGYVARAKWSDYKHLQHSANKQTKDAIHIFCCKRCKVAPSVEFLLLCKSSASS